MFRGSGRYRVMLVRNKNPVTLFAPDLPHLTSGWVVSGNKSFQGTSAAGCCPGRKVQGGWRGEGELWTAPFVYIRLGGSSHWRCGFSTGSKCFFFESSVRESSLFGEVSKSFLLILKAQCFWELESEGNLL